MQSLELFQEWFDKGSLVYGEEKDCMDSKQVLAWCLGVLFFFFHYLQIFLFVPISFLFTGFFMLQIACIFSWEGLQWTAEQDVHCARALAKGTRWLHSRARSTFSQMTDTLWGGSHLCWYICIFHHDGCASLVVAKRFLGFVFLCGFRFFCFFIILLFWSSWRDIQCCGGLFFFFLFIAYSSINHP